MNTLPAADYAASIVKNHWNTIRCGRIAPFRSEIDPNAIVGALENFFILEKVRRGDYRIRVAGTRLCDLKGMEVRGLPLAAFVRDEDRSRLDEVIEMVLNCPSVANISLGGVDGHGKPVSAEILLLPLRSDFGELSRIIGCMTVRPVDPLLPVALKILDVDAEAVVVSETGRGEYPLPGFYEPERTFSAKPKSPRIREVHCNPMPRRRTSETRPQLRLVHDRSNPRIRSRGIPAGQAEP